jgi:sec-independent protein translocase protein TatB
MNFLGIGPGELLLILIVLLVIVGPERLPGLARQMGRWVVMVRNWVQSSPDAALVLRARQELESELAMIKSSLLEVQSIRDEVLDAAKQFNEAVSPLAEVRTSLNDLANPAAGAAQSPDSSGATAELATADTTPAAAEILPAIDYPPAFSPTPITKSELDQIFAVARDTMVEDPWNAPEEPAVAAIEDSWDAPKEPALSSSAIEELNLRIQAIMADLWALQEQLKQHGALDAGWQPPSTNMQLPDPSPQAEVEETDT